MFAFNGGTNKIQTALKTSEITVLKIFIVPFFCGTFLKQESKRKTAMQFVFAIPI